MNVKILIIDDTKALNELITKLIEREGFSTTSACTYQEAKTLLKQESFDLVTLDWDLDLSHTGIDLLPFISEKSKVILLSAKMEYQLAEATQEHEKIDDYIPKMELSQRLIPKIKELLNMG